MIDFKKAWEDVGEIVRFRIVETASTQMQACKAGMSYLENHYSDEFDAVCEISERFTYSRRSYSGGAMYCWPISPDGFDIPAMDPWNGSRFPKSVLCVDILQYLATTDTVKYLVNVSCDGESWQSHYCYSGELVDACQKCHEIACKAPQLQFVVRKVDGTAVNEVVAELETDIYGNMSGEWLERENGRIICWPIWWNGLGECFIEKLTAKA